MKKLIYTVIFNKKDDLKEVRTVTPGWDYIAITEDPEIRSTTWQVKLVDISGKDAKKASRDYKLRPHIHFPEYDQTIYIDGSYLVKGNLDDFAGDRGPGVWMTTHPQRDCAYKEGQAVREKRLDDADTVLEQLARYRDEGYPDRNGLWRGGCILRIGDCSAFNQAWWAEVELGSYRDQLSAPYAAWKTLTPINALPHGHVETYFKPYLHKPFKLTGGVVKASTPDEIRAVDRDKWVCVGECEYAQRATQAYKKVHLIATPNAYIFPRWLFDYTWQLDKIEKLVMLYGGTIVYWNEE